MRTGLAVTAAMLAMSVALIAAPPNCLDCHDDIGTKFKSSIHESVGCTGCHSNVKSFPHGAEARQVQCTSCHSQETAELSQSMHDKVSKQQCSGCHGDAHTIVATKDAASPVYPLNLPKTCGTCHAKPEMAKQYNLADPYAMYMDSIHGFALTKSGLLVSATCSSCHGSHKILGRYDPKSRTNRAGINANCGTCHAGIEQTYMKGIHGKQWAAGNAAAPVCTDCHTSHQISDVQSAAWQLKTTATCGNCHTSKSKTYDDTFHSQVAALKFGKTARCWDCHNAHDILPASDPKSTVATANLITTCGKCHEGANAGFVSYQPHADAHDRKNYPMLTYSSIMMNLLLAGVLGFFGVHTVLWALRSRNGDNDAPGKTPAGRA